MKGYGKVLLLAGAMTIAISAGAGFGADADPRAEDRKLLRVLMAEAEAGINAQSADRLVALMSDDVTVSWLNAEVSRGKAEVKAYHQRMVHYAAGGGLFAGLVLMFVVLRLRRR